MLMVAIEKDQIKLKTKVIERKNIHTLLAMHDHLLSSPYSVERDVLVMRCRLGGAKPKIADHR